MLDQKMIYDLCQTYETPVYIYDPFKIKAAVERARDAFPDFDLIYSVKANPYPPILQLLKNLGVGIDAASANEVLSAARLGHTDIYYSAPGKKPRDIMKTVGAACVIADSFNELETIAAMARQLERTYDVGVRLTLSNPAMAESPFEVMGAGKFGMDPDDFQEFLLPDIKALGRIRVTGLHVYWGSQLMDPSLIAANFNAVTKVATALKEQTPLAYVNYGGGFGIPYESHERALDLPAIAAKIKPPKGLRLNLELGRYLVAEAGIFVCTVTDIKEANGVTYAILDGGMNAFFRPKFTGQRHRVRALGHAHKPADQTYRLVGRSCTPLDVFYEACQLPTLDIGDILTFDNAGAYGYSMSLLDFISFDKPEQVMGAF